MRQPSPVTIAAPRGRPAAATAAAGLQIGILAVAAAWPWVCLIDFIAARPRFGAVPRCVSVWHFALAY